MWCELLRPLTFCPDQHVILIIYFFGYICICKGNQYEIRKHPNIYGQTRYSNPQTLDYPVHCSTNWANQTSFRMLLIAYMNVAGFVMMLRLNYDGIFVATDINFIVLHTSGYIKEISTKSVSIRKLIYWFCTAYGFCANFFRIARRAQYQKNQFLWLRK